MSDTPDGKSPHAGKVFNIGLHPRRVRPTRPILVVVPEWPSGTMAIKFGAMLQEALCVSKDDLTLVQMSPERIFRAVTHVSEDEFREVLVGTGVPKIVLFIELLAG